MTSNRPLILLLLVLNPILLLAEQKLKLGDLPSDTTNKAKTKSRPQDQFSAPTSDDIAEEFYQLGTKAFEEGRLSQAEGYFNRALVLKPEHEGAKAGIENILKIVDEPAADLKMDLARAKLIEQLQVNMQVNYQEGNLDEAEAAATQILAINPQDGATKKLLSQIDLKLYERALERAEAREQAGEERAAIDALQVAQTYHKDPALRTRIQSLRNKILQKNLKKSEDLYVEALAQHQKGNVEDAIKLCKEALSLNAKNFQAKRMLDRLTPMPTP